MCQSLKLCLVSGESLNFICSFTFAFTSLGNKAQHRAVEHWKPDATRLCIGAWQRRGAPISIH